MASKASPIVWKRCRGRNDWDAPQDVPLDMGTEALNWDFYEGGLGSKRGGSASTGTLTNVSGLNAIYGWVPAQDETARELFIVDNSATNQMFRIAAGSSVGSALTLANDIQANDTVISFAVINGKLYIAFNSDENRLHVYDPGLSTTTVRRAGMGTPAAPSAATQGGSGLSFTRHYKVAYTEQRGGVTVRRSELSPADDVTITDDTGVTVTKPAAISEGETHWELYASDTADGTYYLLATTVVGTTTASDTNATIPTTTAAPTAGENTPFPSVKFLYSNGARLFGFGVWETAAGSSVTPQAGTVYLSPALDSSGLHDDERTRNTATAIGRVLLGRNASGVDRGISALGNIIVAFQSKGIYDLIPTENADVPYRRVQASSDLGAVSHQSLIQAEDEHGRPALYFLDPEKGPYRRGADGFQWVGKDVKGVWDTFNAGAANVTAHGVYYKRKHQVWWWIATGSADDPDTMLVLDITELRPDADGDLRGGWSKWTGNLAAARCSTMMSTTLGASMSRQLSPYAGRSSGTTLLKADTSDKDDAGTDFQAYVQSKAFDIEPLFFNKAIVRSYLLAEAANAVTIQQAFVRNFGDETNRTSTVLLTAAGSETRVLRKFEDSALQDAAVFQVRLGDSAAAESGFTLDRWYAEIEEGAAR